MKDLGLLLNNLAIPFDNMAFGQRNMAGRRDNMAQLAINLAFPIDYLAIDDIWRLLQRQKLPSGKILVYRLNNLAVPFDNLAFGEWNMSVRSDNMAQLTINLAFPIDYLALDDI